VPGSRTFKGVGTRELGAIRVNRPTVLTWRTNAKSFEITSLAWRLRSHDGRGRTVLSPGTYRRFAVKATRPWKLTLSPLG
jgi:hypothetical protein